MTYTYDYPRPALTVDCVVFGYDEGALHVLLIERGAPLGDRACRIFGEFAPHRAAHREAHPLAGVGVFGGLV